MFKGFTGCYLHNIDEKGRLTFPVSFRDLLGENPFILKGFDQNLLVMNANRFELLYERINNMNMANAKPANYADISSLPPLKSSSIRPAVLSFLNPYAELLGWMVRL